jgi:hypothetical protein
MRSIAVRTIAACLGVMLSSCGTSPQPASPIAPVVPAPTPAPAPSTIDVTGRWTGTGSDSFSPELVTWVLTQSGSTVSGSVEFNAVDPADGTCGSCHKVKRGAFAGTLSGSSLTLTMKFPAGGNVPTPICVADLAGAATVAGQRIAASYTGTDTCEGFFADGKIELSRQP